MIEKRCIINIENKGTVKPFGKRFIMNKYVFYGSGLWKNNKYLIKAKNKKGAIEKAKKEFHGNITISTFRRVK